MGPPLLLALAMLSGLWPQGVSSQPAAVTLDRIVARVGNDIVQSLDVRQARILALFGPEVATDDSVLDHLIVRRLQLAAAALYTVPDPTPADVAARRQRWAASLTPTGQPPGGLQTRLKDAGMTDDDLTAWFRDDARLEAVENLRFNSPPATADEVAAYVQAHSADFLQPNGQPGRADDPAVQAKARGALASAKRAAAIADWVQALRARTPVEIIK